MSGGDYSLFNPLATFPELPVVHGGQQRRFDEYFRCYPITALRGEANHGGKVFLPPSALDKLTRLHITYPMLFELVNGTASRRTHAGVLEFTAEEGKIHLPRWLMETLSLEPGDLVQVKSTDLPLGNFIKLRPQSTDFLDISDPKAVLEQAFRSFSCLTVGDVFTFAYNDQVYRIAVLEVRPDRASSHAICTLETDLSVDFAAPVGYDDAAKLDNNNNNNEHQLRPPASGASTPRSVSGTMAHAIKYDSIAPSPAAAAATPSKWFLSAGHKVSSYRRGGTSKPATSAPSTPVAAAAITASRGGPQSLRLPPGKLFLGYHIQPVKRKDGTASGDLDGNQPHFQGQGQSLRGKKKKNV